MTDLCNLEPKGLISLDEALQRIKASILPIVGEEPVPLDEALGRVLSEPVFSPINLPFDRNSAMDGYAIASGDIQDNQVFILKLVGTSWAGKPFDGKLESRQCVRIFTGAVVPEGTDTVVMQELVSVDGDHIHFPAGLKAYDNVRQAGEDIQQGSLLCAKGKRLSPADLGLLAAAGIEWVRTVGKLNIAYFSTGDELVTIGKPLTTGKIYDSNRHTLAGLLADPRFDAVDMGVVQDDKRVLKNRVRRMAETNDVVISTGGASVGEADYIHEVLAKLGQVTLWKIALKPGKPLIFGQIGKCYYFGLPGNPVSMMVTYQQIVAPALDSLSGTQPTTALRFFATCTTPLLKSPGRQEFQRGILAQDDNGRFLVASTGSQGSNIISSMSRSNCYIILPADCGGIQSGETVLVEPFANSIYS